MKEGGTSRPPWCVSLSLVSCGWVFLAAFLWSTRQKEFSNDHPSNAETYANDSKSPVSPARVGSRGVRAGGASGDSTCNFHLPPSPVFISVREERRELLTRLPSPVTTLSNHWPSCSLEKIVLQTQEVLVCFLYTGDVLQTHLGSPGAGCW